MIDSIRWLHLSDFHVGKDDYAQRQLFSKIIEHVELKVSESLAPDLIFITGDIANKGLKKEYAEFRAQFYVPLRKMLPQARFFGVPGNHDVQRPSADLLNPKAVLTTQSRFFDPTREGRLAREQITPRFKAYKQELSFDVTPNWLISDAGTYSESISFPTGTVGIVGINTAWLAMSDCDRGNLTPGYNAVESALRSLTKCDVYVVLGHHPLDWLSESESDQLKALFGKYKVIYLHGHLHKVDGRGEFGAGLEYLVIQAGAAFQARSDERWRNGLLWGELDIGRAQLRLSPRFWNQRNLDWPLETGRFPESRKLPNGEWWSWALPQAENGTAIETVCIWLPPGWVFFDKEALSSFASPITAEEAASFFDGAEPNWALAHCMKIPRREIVQKLAARISKDFVRERPQVHLLLGPGGEGKSMALRQAVIDIVEKCAGIGILWHQDESASLSVQQLLALPRRISGWLVVSDCADLIIKELNTAVSGLARVGRADIQFLLAARDTDWRAARGQRLQWQPSVDFFIDVMSGLSEPDAHKIAGAWMQFESAGIHAVDDMDQHALGCALLAASKQGSEVDEGALLGGALALRHGVGLRDHVRILMSRLDEIALPNGRSLRDAFIYISAMHSEGLRFLSRPVLAQLLGCDSATLQEYVVFPLGREAAAGGGTLLLTRHRRIAEMAIAVIREDLGESTDRLYLELAAAAKTAFRRFFIPELHSWDYLLPEHFVVTNSNLACEIGQVLVDADPHNCKLVVSLARLRRMAGSPILGACLLKNFVGDVGESRGFWVEWAACAGEMGSPYLNVLLAAYSLSDKSARRPPNGDSAKRSIAALCVGFSNLFEIYEHQDYSLARGGAALLGLMLPVDEESKARYLRPHWVASSDIGVTQVDAVQALSWVQSGLNLALQSCPEQGELSETVASPQGMSFQGVLTLVDGRAPAV